MTVQKLTIELEGITAADYLAWVRDPEPAALGHALRSVKVDADPLGRVVQAVLEWNAAPPADARVAAGTAGLPATADVRAVRAQIQMNRRHTAEYGVPRALRRPRVALAA